jgi:hypothetical protein
MIESGTAVSDKESFNYGWKLENRPIAGTFVAFVTSYKNGKVVDSYKVMQCDSCALIQKFDAFGYQKAAEDNPVWFCFGCRAKR